MFLFFNHRAFQAKSRQLRHAYIEQQKIYGGLLYLGAILTLISAAFFSAAATPLIVPIFASLFTLGGMFYSAFVSRLEKSHLAAMADEDSTPSPGASYSMVLQRTPPGKEKPLENSNQATISSPAANPTDEASLAEAKGDVLQEVSTANITP